MEACIAHLIALELFTVYCDIINIVAVKNTKFIIYITPWNKTASLYLVDPWLPLRDLTHCSCLAPSGYSTSLPLLLLVERFPYTPCFTSKVTM